MGRATWSLTMSGGALSGNMVSQRNMVTDHVSGMPERNMVTDRTDHVIALRAARMRKGREDERGGEA